MFGSYLNRVGAGGEETAKGWVRFQIKPSDTAQDLEKKNVCTFSLKIITYT
jgi:hypothetical protein